MRHLFPWTERGQRRAAVDRIVWASCPFCPSSAPTLTLKPGELAEHIEAEHGSLLGESWR